MNRDSHVRDDVQRELAYNPKLNAAAIGVVVEDGVVTLTGKVRTYAQKVEALHAAERITGVRAVASELIVFLPGPLERTDADLARAAANALVWSSLVPSDRIRLWVQSGWIVLEGTVDWQYQKDAAVTTVSALQGVRGVENLVTVNPALDPEDTKGQIEAALRRSAAVEDRNILVEVNRDKVVLHGEVRSIAEREEAERIAWSAPGVADVSNHILVLAVVAVGS